MGYGGSKSGCVRRVTSVICTGSLKERNKLFFGAFPGTLRPEKGVKHPHPSQLKPPRISPYDSQRDRSTEVRELLHKLQDKHGSKYSAEQLHTWANLVQMKMHSSFDDPPITHFSEATKSIQNQEALHQRVHLLMRKEFRLEFLMESD